MNSFVNSVKVGWTLAVSRVRRTSFLATGLIVIVMTLTFLNLLVVRGILVGLPKGAIIANEEKYYADLYISALDGKKHIEESRLIEDALDNVEGIEKYSIRYISRGTAEADYNKRTASDEEPNSINAAFIGVDVEKEEYMINISQSLKEGKMIDKNSLNTVVLGTDLVSKFEIGEITGNQTLDNVDIGTTLKLTIQGVTKKVKVAGFINSKVSELDNRIIMSQELFKEFVPRDDFKPEEISVRIKPGYTSDEIKSQLEEMGLQKYVTIETPKEYQPSFVEDLINTFAILGDFVGTISLTVASITVFIIIFVNAITQRKYIGILKGVGISGFAIEFSYVIQAVFYVLIGSLISIPLLYLVLVPYFQMHPLDFPFADGILVAEYSQTISRTVSMYITTAVAGYIPARYIVKQNTLDAILGR